MCDYFLTRQETDIIEVPSRPGTMAQTPRHQKHERDTEYERMTDFFERNRADASLFKGWAL